MVNLEIVEWLKHIWSFGYPHDRLWYLFPTFMGVVTGTFAWDLIILFVEADVCSCCVADCCVTSSSCKIVYILSKSNSGCVFLIHRWLFWNLGPSALFLSSSLKTWMVSRKISHMRFTNLMFMCTNQVLEFISKTDLHSFPLFSSSYLNFYIHYTV